MRGKTITVITTSSLDGEKYYGLTNQNLHWLVESPERSVSNEANLPIESKEGSQNDLTSWFCSDGKGG